MVCYCGGGIYIGVYVRGFFICIQKTISIRLSNKKIVFSIVLLTKLSSQSCFRYIGISKNSIFKKCKGSIRIADNKSIHDKCGIMPEEQRKAT